MQRRRFCAHQQYTTERTRGQKVQAGKKLREIELVLFKKVPDTHFDEAEGPKVNHDPDDYSRAASPIQGNNENSHTKNAANVN